MQTKHQKILKQIELEIDEKASNQIELKEENKTEGLRIEDLLKNLEQKQSHITKIKQQYHDYNTKSGKIPEILSDKMQDRAERKANYKIITKDMKKWQGIIKKNREIEHLDFSNKLKKDTKRINTDEGKLIAHEITDPLQNKLKELNIENENSYKKKEEILIKNLDPAEQKQKISELARNKNLLFYQEIKNKRLANIKSKLYHKLKNKKIRNEALKKAQNDPSFKKQELEKLKIQRAEERLSLRHKMQSKYVKNLIRYGGDKAEITNSINEVNKIRKDLLNKINENDFEEEDSYEELEEKELKEKAINDLEREFLQNDEKKESNNKNSGLKFLDRFVDKKKNQIKNEASKLLRKLKEDENLSGSEEEKKDLSDDELSNNEENKEKRENLKRKREMLENKEEFIGRKKFKKDEKTDKSKEAKPLKPKNQANTTKLLKDYIEDKENPTTIIPEKQNNMIEEKSNDNLLEGINLNKLQQKYNGKSNIQFKKSDMEKFSLENTETFNEISHIAVADTNEQDFQDEKLKEMELETIKPIPKFFKGWGSWTGAGIEEKKQISEEEQLIRKKKQIEEIKKKRADGKLDHVILNENRNAKFSKYLVSELPMPFKSKEQFNFLNNIPLGSEWNTMTSHHKLIKPSIKTVKGEIIEPIRYKEAKKRK